MGTGFWVIQGILLTAAIATAIYAELERRRDQEVSARKDYRRVPVERSNDFTIHEQARLLLLRGRIREARLGRGRLHDDLAPDAREPPALPSVRARAVRQPQAPGVLMPPTVGGSHAPAGADPVPAPRVPRWSSGALILLAGVLLFAVGAGGMWRTNAAMDSIERAQQQLSGSVHTSLMARVLPGPIANPAKYLGAVNGSAGNSASLDAVATLAQKQAMDRWAALVLLGLALLVFKFSRPKMTPDGEQQTSVAGDLVGIIGLAALLFMSLSFFELP